MFRRRFSLAKIAPTVTSLASFMSVLTDAIKTDNPLESAIGRPACKNKQRAYNGGSLSATAALATEQKKPSAATDGFHFIVPSLFWNRATQSTKREKPRKQGAVFPKKALRFHSESGQIRTLPAPTGPTYVCR